ncbi:MAG: flagellar hook protein [Oscillospiraceae bacterium]|nr:flagellar hook protein [Oscillospiraceae bacterium]
MGMVVQHNMNALSAYNKLNTNVAGLKKSSEKLSSGYRINRAGDDAAGLAISEKMRSQIRGLNQAKRNSQDGISMIQTFEGALQESHSILQRMKELATESANGTYQTEVDRDAIQLEFNQLNDELDQIADTDFNGTVMLNGGTMADGTRAVGGKFDYTSINNKRSALELGPSDFKVGEAKGSIAKDETVTFTYTASTGTDAGKGTWTQTGGTPGSFTSKDTGGFVYDGLVFSADTSEFVTGDSVTIKFEKQTDEVKQAASNIGYTVTGGNAPKDQIASIAAGTDAPTSQLEADMINSLQGATVSFTVDGTSGKIADTTTPFITLTDGTAVKYGDTPAADGELCANIDSGIIKIYGNINGAKKELVTINGATAVTENKGKTGEITLAFADAVYQPKSEAKYEILGTTTVSKANSNSAATAPLTYTDHLVLQSGARTKDSVDFTFAYKTDGMGELKANLDVSSRANGLNTSNLSLNTQEGANAAIDQIDNAINKVSMVRATFGATQNRLEHKVENLTTTAENLTEAEAGIRDTDMAQEMLNYTKFNVLQQAAQSMLAQANQQPQSILQLLG